ncbi:DUF3786 domain-containing protein [Candidatus Electronema sp. PJ]|uniref:DUF3786 domain-containing protein n=1 Tax=Candidatus Electronema sp. PJ TaxID=3401572 RepID=UPI003AA7D0CB
MTHLEIYQVLAKTNCGRCQLPSCLAFAAAVTAGQKKLADCPLLNKQVHEQLLVGLSEQPESELHQFTEHLQQLKHQIVRLDLATLAPHLGGVFQNGRLVLSSFGKDFQIDQQGQVHSECHLIPWIKVLLLAYIASAQHQEITGRWLNFRDLPGGMERRNLFASRCERLLKQLADQHPGLLHDLADLFLGVPASGFNADLALILHPLPHFPVLICWQAPEDGMDSELTVLFDACCGVNLPAQLILALGIGMARMFEKIALLHK